MIALSVAQIAEIVGGELADITPAEAAARAERDLCLVILNLNEFSYVD